MSPQVLFSRVIEVLVANENRSLSTANPAYVTGEGHKAYGVSIVLLRKLLKPYFASYGALTFSERLDFAARLYDTKMAEAIISANAFLGKEVGKYSVSEMREILRLVDGLISWDTTDDFCMLLSLKFFFLYPEIMTPVLREWNKSPHVWVRRASVVTLTRKVGASGRHTSLILELCENLINDDHDLIRKAVGWCLKDALRGDKDSIISYVRELRHRGVSAVTTLYAIRDIKGELRQEIINCKPD